MPTSSSRTSRAKGKKKSRSIYALRQWRLKNLERLTEVRSRLLDLSSKTKELRFRILPPTSANIGEELLMLRESLNQCATWIHELAQSPKPRMPVRRSKRSGKRPRTRTLA